MRIVFMGTPEFAVPSLNQLIQDGHNIVGVYTQPDKPKNRGMKLTPPPVKVVAQANHLPVFQPKTLKDEAVQQELAALAPELIVVAAYGKLLPKAVLELPEKGCINVHSSLLPKYRGAAPINWAMLNGEPETGVTIMHMAAELDAGDIILQAATPIHPEEDAEMLYARLAELGGPLLVEAVAQIEAGTAARTPQDPKGVSFAPMLSKELSPVDWSRSAQEIHDQIRGLMAWPRASTDVLGGEAVKLYRSQVLAEKRSGTAGTVLGGGKAGIDVLCGDGKVLRITELQAPGSRRMSAADYLRGHPLGN